MAVQNFYIKENDTKPDLQVTLKDFADAAVDVTGATVVFTMKKRFGASTAKVDEQSCTLVTPSSGIVRYEWQVGDTDTPEEYLGEFEVTYSGGGIETFPNNEDNILVIHVRSELG